jgi:hypothetical protein
MFAAHHDQENLFAHQASTAKQQLQAKTPAARFPKTPLKVPLNDENTNHGLSGKSVLRTKGNNENIATTGKGGNGIGKSGRAALVTPGGACRTMAGYCMASSDKQLTTCRAPDCSSTSWKQDYQRESQDAADPWSEAACAGL